MSFNNYQVHLGLRHAHHVRGHAAHPAREEARPEQRGDGRHGGGALPAGALQERRRRDEHEELHGEQKIEALPIMLFN